MAWKPRGDALDEPPASHGAAPNTYREFAREAYQVVDLVGFASLAER